MSPPLSLRHPIIYQICRESSILSVIRGETENFIFGGRLSMWWMLMVIVLLLSTLRVVRLLVWVLRALCYHSFSSRQSKTTCSVWPLGSQAPHPRAPEHTARALLPGTKTLCGHGPLVPPTSGSSPPHLSADTDHYVGWTDTHTDPYTKPQNQTGSSVCFCWNSINVAESHSRF